LTGTAAREHDAGVYVAGLVIVAAIVNWLADTLGAVIVTKYVVPYMQRARRERAAEVGGGAYLRGIAAARFVRYAVDAMAVLATCYYYAENNVPVWPAWATFGLFFAAFHLPRLATAAAQLAGFRRSRA